MNPPVRMVCGGCLRSVDVPGDAMESAANLCPYCGGPIDSRSESDRAARGGSGWRGE